MQKRQYLEIWPEDPVYENVAWDLPGLKRNTNPPARLTRIQPRRQTK